MLWDVFEAHVVGRAWWIDNACGTGALIGALIKPADLVNLEGLRTLCHVMDVSKIIPQGLCCGTCSGPMLWDDMPYPVTDSNRRGPPDDRVDMSTILQKEHATWNVTMTVVPWVAGLRTG